MLMGGNNDDGENSPLTMSNRAMNVFKTPDKIVAKKKPSYHRPFSNLDNENVVLPIRKH